MKAASYIVTSALFFWPYIVFALLASLPFSLALRRHFLTDSPGAGFVARTSAALVYFTMFSIFGVVTAYFMSLGLISGSRDVANPLIEKFGTPFVALLTAALGFVAQKDVPRERMITVPAGVICFIFTTLILYKAAEIGFADQKRDTVNSMIDDARKD